MSSGEFRDFFWACHVANESSANAIFAPSCRNRGLAQQSNRTTLEKTKQKQITGSMSFQVANVRAKAVELKSDRPYDLLRIDTKSSPAASEIALLLIKPDETASVPRRVASARPLATLWGPLVRETKSSGCSCCISSKKHLQSIVLEGVPNGRPPLLQYGVLVHRDQGECPEAQNLSIQGSSPGTDAWGQWAVCPPLIFPKSS